MEECRERWRRVRIGEEGRLGKWEEGGDWGRRKKVGEDGGGGGLGKGEEGRE